MREPGYYWVKTQETKFVPSGWAIFEFRYGYWTCCGCEEPWDEWAFEIIGEISGDCTVSGTLRDASSVIVGKITVTLTANIPGITLSGNSANIELSGNKPVITFSEG